MMDLLNGWIFQPEFWIILSIVLIGADVLFGFQFFVLSIGVASLLIAGLLALQNAGHHQFLETWREIGYVLSALSLALVAVIKFVFQKNKRDQPDINEY